MRKCAGSTKWSVIRYLRVAILYTGVLTSVLVSSVGNTANKDVFDRLLKQHFYKPDALSDVENQTIAEVLSSFKSSGIDPWIRLLTPEENRDLIAATSNDNYGLQLFQQEETFYFIPTLDGPNDRTEFRAYEIKAAPEDGNWRGTLESADESIVGVAEKFKFNTGAYHTKDTRLSGAEIRVDNFTNLEQISYFTQYAEEISRVRFIDLRFNGGGGIAPAVSFLAALLGTEASFGSIKKQDQIERYGVSGSSIDLDLSNVTVIVSRHTASAAEWIVRILQLYGAVVIGERTTGKCLLHGVYPVGGRQSISFAIGELEVFDQSGYNYCGHGIIPDLTVNPQLLIQSNTRELVKNVKRCVADNQTGLSATRECKLLVPGMSNSRLDALKNSNNEKSSTALSVTVDREDTEPYIQKEFDEITVSSLQNDGGNTEVSTHVVDDEIPIRGTDSPHNDSPSYHVCVEDQWKLQLISYERLKDAKKFIMEFRTLKLEERALIQQVDIKGRSFFRVLLPLVEGVDRVREIQKVIDETFSIRSQAHKIDKASAYLAHITSMIDSKELLFEERKNSTVCSLLAMDITAAQAFADEYREVTGLKLELRQFH